MNLTCFCGSNSFYVSKNHYVARCVKCGKHYNASGEFMGTIEPKGNKIELTPMRMPEIKQCGKQSG